MDKSKIKVIAMDLDGTLTQHKQPLSPEARATLEALAKKYKLLMVGAGQVMRIFNQMEHFPIDIIGNYGLQYATYNAETGEMDVQRDLTLPLGEKDAVEAKVSALREKYGYTEFAGDNVEYHPSGCLTFPVLGTKAQQADKLAFDPDRVKRRKIYAEVCEAFPDYCVFLRRLTWLPSPITSTTRWTCIAKKRVLLMKMCCLLATTTVPAAMTRLCICRISPSCA